MPESRPRVAVVIHGYFPRVGGAETQLKELAPRLMNRSVDLHILTRKYVPGLSSFERIDGVPVYRLPAPGPKLMASLMFTLFALLKLLRLRPQLVHAHEFISPATVALLARRWLKIPIVITPHRSGSIGDVQKMNHKPGGEMKLRTIKNKTDHFVVISDEIERELLGLGISESRMARIANGVDIDRFTPPSVEERKGLRSKLNLPSDAVVVIFSGRLVPEKRLDLLLAAWEVLQVDYSKAALLILGTGPEEKKLKDRANGKVLFLGSRDDVVPWLKASDLFVLPSDAEGFSVALLEAMACGLAPLVTDVGGAREVIRHADNGWLIPPGNQRELETSLKLMVGDPGLIRKLGRNARKKVADNYSVDNAADQLASLYRHLIDGAVL